MNVITSKHKAITVDEQGRSRIVSVNRDEHVRAGRYGANLTVGDEVELMMDKTPWTVDKIHTHIQSGNPGAGAGNYLIVNLVQRESR